MDCPFGGLSDSWTAVVSNRSPLVLDGCLRTCLFCASVCNVWVQRSRVRVPWVVSSFLGKHSLLSAAAILGLVECTICIHSQGSLARQSGTLSHSPCLAGDRFRFLVNFLWASWKFHGGGHSVLHLPSLVTWAIRTYVPNQKWLTVASASFSWRSSTC